MLSSLCKEIADKYGIIVGDVKKLFPNLGNKSNYILHYKYLQLYLLLGVKLTKIHKVLKCNQSDWLKNYIDFNTEKKNATSFGKDFFKLMIDSVYGKTMEKLTKRITNAKKKKNKNPTLNKPKKEFTTQNNQLSTKNLPVGGRFIIN